MVYKTKSIIKDVNGKPVPQHWNSGKNNFEVVEGVNGMLKIIMVDGQGNEVQPQDVVDQISNKLDELIQAVSG